MKKLFWLNLIFGLGVLAPSFAHAATFNPANAADLQAALTQAQSNGEDDTINLSGTYSITSTLVYSAAENNALTITGAGASSTILDGGSAHSIMSLGSSGTGLVSISGLTFQNGSGTTSNGALALASGGGLDIQNNVFSNNTVSGTGGGAFFLVASAGNITFSGNTASHNSATATNTTGAGAISALSGEITANNNIISDNDSDGSYGGLVLQASGNLTFNGNTVSSNTANGSQGGVSVASVAGSVIMNSNTISGNEADAGSAGGMQILAAASITFNGNTLTGNKAPTGQGGGGVAVSTSGGDISMNANTIQGNVSATGVGGMNVTTAGDISFTNNTVSQNTNSGTSVGGLLLQSSLGSLTVTGNTFSGNESSGVGSTGGALQAYANAGIDFSQNIVTGNSAETYGGVFMQLLGPGSVQIVNNVVAGNSSTSEIGGLQVIDGSTGSATALSFLNNTIYNNTTAGNFAGAALIALDASVTVNAYNNILYGNANSGSMGVGEDFFVINPSSVLNVFNNDIGEVCFTNPASCDLAGLGAHAADNLSAVDPSFIDAASSNYRLQGSSALIDVGLASAPGLPTIDVIGNPRSFLSIPDIGAYEAVPNLATDPSSQDFGEVNTNSESTVIITVSNSGSYPLNISGIALSDTVNFALQPSTGASPCASTSFSLEAGESCTLGLQFSPGTVGAITADLVFSSDDPANPSYSLPLTGTGTASSGCALSQGAENASAFGILMGILAFYAALRLGRSAQR